MLRLVLLANGVIYVLVAVTLILFPAVGRRLADTGLRLHRAGNGPYRRPAPAGIAGM